MEATVFDTNVIVMQVVWSSIVVWLLNKAKQSQLPFMQWINEHSWWVNRWCAVIASGAVALGLHWTYSYDPAIENGTLVFTLTGASIGGLVEHLRDWIFSYVIQQMGYKATKEKQ